MGEDDPRQGHLAHGQGRPALRSLRPWGRTNRAEVTSPMGEDDPCRGLSKKDFRKRYKNLVVEMDSCLPYKTAMVSLNTSCLDYTGNWNPFGKTNGCFLGKIVKTYKSQNGPKGALTAAKRPTYDFRTGLSLSLALEGGGYGPISHATAHAQAGMTIDADKDKQTHDGTSVNANAERTPAGNLSTVTTNAVILDQMKEMFAFAVKKSNEEGKLVASLAKQVETLTAPRSPRPWARTTRTEVTSPMGEDDPHRGHLAHGRGPTSCPETVHPRLSSRNTILGPLDAIPMSRLA
ncbi:hypothetical protein F2Q68_00035460 [Brassica cretica]|uniref:Uncharacterized protein n=1 Tax=Brassica cretica TaxID=69181 RepID=A0A8S9H392_BRACR|nr:hypothetical protein F2Q68_00035460 [Brassica cretica]